MGTEKSHIIIAELYHLYILVEGSIGMRLFLRLNYLSKPWIAPHKFYWSLWKKTNSIGWWRNMIVLCIMFTRFSLLRKDHARSKLHCQPSRRMVEHSSRATSDYWIIILTKRLCHYLNVLRWFDGEENCLLNRERNGTRTLFSKRRAEVK
jgi:hypothetical protein